MAEEDAKWKEVNVNGEGEEEALPPVAVATQKTGNSRRQQLHALHGQKGKKTFFIFPPLNVKLWAEILKSQSFTGSVCVDLKSISTATLPSCGEKL